MKVTIEYCTSWGYDLQALSLRDSLTSKFGLEVELIPSSGGIFVVMYYHHSNAKSLLFSKDLEKRFPNPGEIEDLIEGLYEVT